MDVVDLTSHYFQRITSKEVETNSNSNWKLQHLTGLLTKKELDQIYVVEPPETFTQKLKKWFAYMEIVVALHIIATCHTNTIVKDVLLDKTCRVNLLYDPQLCDEIQLRNVTAFEMEEMETQKYVAWIESWSSIIENIFQPIILLVLGAWSDKYGRKVTLYVALSGHMVRYVGLISSIYFVSWPAEVVALCATLPVALTGRTESVLMALNSHIADTTSFKQRTFRLAVAISVYNMATSIGTFVFGFLTKTGLGPLEMFALSTLINGGAIAYAVFLIPNAKINKLDKKIKEVLESTKAPSSCSNLVNLKTFLHTLKIPFQKRIGSLGLLLNALLIVICLFIVSDEQRIMYLYARYKFQWDGGDFAYFSSISTFVRFGGGIVTASVLSRMLGMSDSMMGLLGCVSQFGSSLLYAFASQPWIMYLAASVDALDGTVLISATSMITKIVDEDEVGRTNAFIGMVRSVSKLPNGPIYSYIYDATLTTFPGAAFIVTAACAVPSLLIFGIYWKWGKTSQRQDYTQLP